ncbi:hypothetical protein LY76DRAFT_671615 [Colletotrichum caudatum]|nr:hypothetical protein LY76DRAFT_671615 [Colletotrichum caudatum]
MAPQLHAAQRALIKTLLIQGFENQLIASKAECSIRTVQQMRRQRPDSEMPSRKSASVGRRRRMTMRMQKALCDQLIKQPYMYRCEMADFCIATLTRKYRNDQSAGPYDPLDGRERQSAVSHNNGMMTFTTTTCIASRSINLISSSLSTSLAVTGGRDTDVGGGLRRVPPQ